MRPEDIDFVRAEFKDFFQSIQEKTGKVTYLKYEFDKIKIIVWDEEKQASFNETIFVGESNS